MKKERERMKKKLVAVTLGMMLVFSMTACGGSDADSADAPARTEQAEADEGAEDAGTDEEVTVEEGTEVNADDEFTLWNVVPAETPEIVNTTWSISGGNFEGEEMDQEQLDATLEMYGGQLDFVFGEDGAAQMVQGGGVLEGTYQLLEDGSVGLVFDNNGEDLPDVCVFTEMNDMTVMVAITDEEGKNGLYFSQQ